MYKDSKGYPLTIHAVVLTEDGELYSVEDFEDTLRDYNIKCRNSCVVAYFKPEQLTCVNNLVDTKM